MVGFDTTEKCKHLWPIEAVSHAGAIVYNCALKGCAHCTIKVFDGI